MEKTARYFPIKGRLAAAAAACMMLAAGATAAYAADVGGVQRTMQLWLHGDQTAATITFDGAGNYTMAYTDEQGQIRQQTGGGVALAPDGTPVAATEQELLDELTAPEVDYLEDGTVWLYWFGQSVELTDQFTDGVCYVTLNNGQETLYVTVKYQNGYASSPNKYISPDAFN